MNRTLPYLTALGLAAPMLAGIARAADPPARPEPISPPRAGGFVQPGTSPLLRLLMPATQSALKVTPEQKTKLAAIQAKFDEDRRALGRQTAPLPAGQAGQPELGQKLRALRDKADAD